ncbi:hypothetical protein [Uliginosibacterium sp. H1]|uniref:hypothetical protein n=1 Tax=Uliginosibacterium sp. H1 TaxID=3114757 RepID=UPI002E174962|nr:hypothetical protein [Uliginosibacterium sp. H1]
MDEQLQKAYEQWNQSVEDYRHQLERTVAEQCVTGLFAASRDLEIAYLTLQARLKEVERRRASSEELPALCIAA